MSMMISQWDANELKAALFVLASQVRAQNPPIGAAAAGQTVDDLALYPGGPQSRIRISFEVHQA
jgi:hypothetical protein